MGNKIWVPAKWLIGGLSVWRFGFLEILGVLLLLFFNLKKAELLTIFC